MAIQRIVCFKFNATAGEKDRQAHMEALANLQRDISVISDYRAGLAISGDNGDDPQYDSLHYLTFATIEDVDIYFEHDAHQQFIADYKHLWESVFVLNASIDKKPDSFS